MACAAAGASGTLYNNAQCSGTSIGTLNGGVTSAPVSGTPVGSPVPPAAATQGQHCFAVLCPLFAELEKETLCAFYHENDYPLIAKFLLKCRGERTKVIRYHDLNIRT